METLRNYLDQMFARYPETPEAIRAKAELWQMMEDKYNELTSGGAKESEAVGTVIAEFGDLEEVADSLGISTMLATTGPTAEKTESVSSNETVESANTGEKITGAAESSPTLIFGGPSIFDTDSTGNTTSADSIYGGTGNTSSADSIYSNTSNTPVADGDFKNAGSDSASSSDTIRVEAETVDAGNTGERNGAWWAWHNSYDDSAAGQRIFNASNTVLSVYWPTVTCIYL